MEYHVSLGHFHLVIFVSSLFLLSMRSGSSIPLVSVSLRYTRFSLNIYVRFYDDYLNSEWFGVMSSNGDMITIYDPKKRR